MFGLAAVCAMGAFAEVESQRELELTGRAERDNWGVPTSFGMKGSPAALVRQSCGSYKFNVTGLVKSGKPFSVVAYVQADGPSKFGCWNALHHMSGFYRGLEIEATDDVWIDDVWCRGDVRRKEAEVHVSLRGVARGGTDRGLTSKWS